MQETDQSSRQNKCPKEEMDARQMKAPKTMSRVMTKRGIHFLVE